MHIYIYIPTVYPNGSTNLQLNYGTRPTAADSSLYPDGYPAGSYMCHAQLLWNLWFMVDITIVNGD